jgi:DNA polymerase-3 subunit epsilon
MKYAIVDIETTGPNPLRDKIIDIAIYIHDGESVVDSFSSLINPECSIPPFISRLTGIDSEMVQSAPRFYEVAKQIVQITDGAVFVAHNASFDYSFTRHEFKSLGFNFSKNYLCTLRLSRKLLKGYPAYGLGRLCGYLGIPIENRHRASGDAEATTKLFDILLEKNRELNVFPEFMQNDYLSFRFPPGFNKKIVEDLPEECGVYYMHNEEGKIIYIGKSKNIRNRVLSHFSNKQSKKAIELRNSIHAITFELTGNELVALLLESEEIKKWQPVFNSAQRRSYTSAGIYLTENEDGYLNLTSYSENEHDEPVLTAASKNHVTQILSRLIDKYSLCQKMCEQDINGKCFNYTVHLCKGACVGHESPQEYNKRVMKAVKSMKLRYQNFMIIGNGRSSDEKSVIHVEQGKYRGFGYFSPEFTSPDPESLMDVVVSRPDNRDVQRILRQSMKNIQENNLITW